MKLCPAHPNKRWQLLWPDFWLEQSKLNLSVPLVTLFIAYFCSVYPGPLCKAAFYSQDCLGEMK